ncbi:protein required for attachment to host cells [Bradyrhizobium sp. LA8.1]
MRKHLHRDLRGKTIGEFAKDFSRRPLEDIASLIADSWRASGKDCRRKPVQP